MRRFDQSTGAKVYLGEGSIHFGLKLAGVPLPGTFVQVGVEDPDHLPLPCALPGDRALPGPLPTLEPVFGEVEGRGMSRACGSAKVEHSAATAAAERQGRG